MKGAEDARVIFLQKAGSSIGDQDFTHAAHRSGTVGDAVPRWRVLHCVVENGSRALIIDAGIEEEPVSYHVDETSEAVARSPGGAA